MLPLLKYDVQENVSLLTLLVNVRPPTRDRASSTMTFNPLSFSNFADDKPEESSNLKNKQL